MRQSTKTYPLRSLFLWTRGDSAKNIFARRRSQKFPGHTRTTPRALGVPALAFEFPRILQKIISHYAPHSALYFCGPEETRTPYLVNANDALYQMSYGPLLHPNPCRDAGNPCPSVRRGTQSPRTCESRCSTLIVSSKSLSGCRESNPVSTHPKRVYYRYTTSRQEF